MSMVKEERRRRWSGGERSRLSPPGRLPDLALSVSRARKAPQVNGQCSVWSDTAPRYEPRDKQFEGRSSTRKEWDEKRRANRKKPNSGASDMTPVPGLPAS